MRRWSVLFALCLLLALSACGGSEEPVGLKLWFPTASEPGQPFSQAISWETLDTDQPATVDSLVAALLRGPDSGTLAGPFLPDTRLLGWTVDRGVLYLDMSGAYGDLTGISLTLADYCLTLTLCQLEEVEQVCITVNGQEVAYRVRQVLSPEDVIVTGAEEEPRQVDAVLYFPRAMGKGLGFEVRELTLTEDDDFYVMVTETLMAGPEDPDLHALLPENVALLGASVDDGVCYVNFSADFLDFPADRLEEQRLLLYSIVDTLGNLNAVTAVQLLVEGEVVPSFGGQDTSLPLEPDFGLVGGER